MCYILVMAYNDILTNNTIPALSSLKIKIFTPLSNKDWLQEKVNSWLGEHKVEVVNMNMNFTEDKYILTILYREIDQ
jgi:hypothetical protein